VTVDLNILLSGVVGSTAYGLAGPDSDVDRLGVYAAPTVQFHGLHPPIGKAASIVRNDPDVTYHEAGKLAALCLGGNPTVTELLYLDSYEVTTPLGVELVEIRSAFASAQRCRDAYFGYATAQLHRLLNTGQFKSKMRKRVEKHARHLLRLLDQGHELYATGNLTIRVADPQRYLAFGVRVAKDPENARAALADAEAKFDATRSPLPDRPDEAKVEAWLHHVREAFLRQTTGRTVRLDGLR
jgi:predicted nucleotidyltransferase